MIETKEPGLSLEKFNPTKAEVSLFVEDCKGLMALELNGKEHFEIVNTARKGLKAKRVEIQKTGKELRADAIGFQKKVIELEKELVAIIEPVEEGLKEKTETYQAQIEYDKRKPRYSEFMEKFKALGYDLTEGEYCSGNDAGIFAKLTRLEQEKLAIERAVLEEQQAAIERQKLELEQERVALEREKQKQIEIEAARKEEAEKVKLEIESKQAQEKANKINELLILAGQEHYHAWLSSHDYKLDGDFLIKQSDSKIILYKKLGEYTKGEICQKQTK